MHAGSTGLDSGAGVGVQLLQRVDGGVLLLHGGNAFNGRLCGSDGGDGGNAGQDSGAADGLLVEERILPARRVDDELNAISLDEIDDVGTAFLYFEDSLHG